MTKERTYDLLLSLLSFFDAAQEGHSSYSAEYCALQFRHIFTFALFFEMPHGLQKPGLKQPFVSSGTQSGQAQPFFSFILFP